MSEVETTAYSFTFSDGTSRTLSVKLRRPSLELVSPPDTEEAEWTRLEFHQCPNCPLSTVEQPHCPVAINLVPVNAAFCERLSYEEVHVVVHAEARTYQKTCPLHEAVSSLMGLIMATSGCPHLDKLRPMVFTHLPFATVDQTTYRAISMYLLAQYFRRRHGLAPDWELEELSRTYQDIHTVNVAFAKRLASIQKKDANLNAVVKLDSQADITSFSIAEQWWEELEPIFLPYLRS
jgi:hypothetical protein